MNKEVRLAWVRRHRRDMTSYKTWAFLDYKASERAVIFEDTHPYICDQLNKNNINPLLIMCKLEGYKIAQIGEQARDNLIRKNIKRLLTET